MKKYILCLIILGAGTLTASAQRVGVKVGLNVPNISAKVGDEKVETTSTIGFHVGAVAELKLIQSLYFNTGVMFTQKGYKTEADILGLFQVESQTNVYYLEIPLNLAYKLDLGPAALFAQAGPYVGFALFGNVKVNDENNSIDFGSDDDEQRAIDAGIGFGVGAEILALQIGIGYQLGITNWSNVDDVTAYNRLLSVSVAYLFGK